MLEVKETDGCIVIALPKIKEKGKYSQTAPQGNTQMLVKECIFVLIDKIAQPKERQEPEHIAPRKEQKHDDGEQRPDIGTEYFLAGVGYNGADEKIFQKPHPPTVQISEVGDAVNSHGLSIKEVIKQYEDRSKTDYGQEQLNGSFR